MSLHQQTTTVMQRAKNQPKFPFAKEFLLEKKTRREHRRIRDPTDYWFNRKNTIWIFKM